MKADPNIKAQGFVLEARQQELEEERGSTLIVQKGCLRVGDVVVIGCQYGKVRTMKDDRGNSLTEALPSYAVEIVNFTCILFRLDSKRCPRQGRSSL